MYDYCIIDAQWLLARNYYAIRGSESNRLPDNGYSIIASSVIRSIMKLTETFQFRKAILLFDTYPYHKHTILSGDYKSSRSYTTDEMVEECEDPEEKARLEIDAHNLNQRGQAKWLIKELGPYGLPSFYKKGYEADDLAYIVANKIQDLGKSGILVSIDNDWNYWINPSVDWYSPSYGITTYLDTLKNIPIPEGLTLFEYKRYYDSFYGSHNDFWQTCQDDKYDFSFPDFYAMFKDKGVCEELFKEPQLFKMQYEALDIENYPEIRKVHSMMYYLDKTGGIPSKGMWEKFRSRKCLPITDTEYFRFLNKLDWSLFYD